MVSLRSISTPQSARPTSRVTAVLLSLALVGSACGDDSDTTAASATESTSGTSGGTESTGAATDTDTDTDTDTGTGTDSDTGGMLNDFPVGGCGLPEYPLVDAAAMGEIVDYQELFTFSAADLDTLLADQGFAALTPVKSGATLYLVRYVTQDRGEALEATGYIAVPTDLDGPLPVATWLHGTSGFNDACGPTADSQQGFIPMMMAGLGLIAVAPDYIGLNGWGDPSGRLHPYIIAEPTAIASLDSIRAVNRFVTGEGPDLGTLAPNGQNLLWGASEGGFAALWSDRYAPHYAPELDITAVIAGVPPTDPFALVQYAVSGLNPATGAFAAALGSSHEWYRLEAPLSEVFESPWDGQIMDILANGCSYDQFDGVSDVGDVYTQWLRDAAAIGDPDGIDAWGCILERAGLGDPTIERLNDTPVLFSLGELDDLVYTPTVKDDVPSLCDFGYDIEVIECAGAGHADGVINSLTYQRDWAFAILDGGSLGGETCVLNGPVDCAAL
ncbi:MAG: lipase family protein [Nannocystaceae bacterium]